MKLNDVVFIPNVYKQHAAANTCFGFQPTGFATFASAKLLQTSCIRDTNPAVKNVVSNNLRFSGTIF